jgi:hypothetical protein
MIIFLNIFTIHVIKTNTNKFKKGVCIDGRDMTPVRETNTTVGSKNQAQQMQYRKMSTRKMA